MIHNLMKVKATVFCLVSLIAANTAVYAGTMGSDNERVPPGEIYLGAFGGGGTLSSLSMSQKATAFFPTILGGALAVNAKGVSNKTSGWMAGGHIGYHWPMRSLRHIDANLMVSPSIELEGYYIGGITVEGHEINNNTARLIEHDFLVTLPMETGVFLTNFILKFNSFSFQKIYPYLGMGAGVAVVSVSDATSIQTAPAEPYNHYNSDTNDTNLSFAAQPKIGISFSLNNGTNVFAEYRFLYLSSSDYTFGSTVYPGPHVPTSNWAVRVHSKYYNFGTIGLQYDL